MSGTSTTTTSRSPRGWFTELPPRYQHLATLSAQADRATVMVHDRQAGTERVLKLRRDPDPESLDELRSEFTRLLELVHPRLVRPFALEAFAGGRVAALVLEYVPGTSVRRVAGRVSLEQALAIARAVAEGLVFLHRRGVLHGDLKPENLLLPVSDPEAAERTGGGTPALDAAIGRLKIADFGLSLAVGGSLRGGTPGFIAPEIAAGARYDERAEIFALGVVLWELLTGGLLAVGGADPLAFARAFRPAAPSAVRCSIDPVVDGLVLRALAVDPALRFAGAGAFLAAVDDLQLLLDLRPPARPEPRLLADPWIERPTASAALGAALQPGGAILLVGPPAFGKSMLLDRLRRSLCLAGRSVQMLPVTRGDVALEPFTRLVEGGRGTDAGDAAGRPAAAEAEAEEAEEEEEEGVAETEGVAEKEGEEVAETEGVAEKEGEGSGQELTSRHEAELDHRIDALLARVRAYLDSPARPVFIADDADRLPAPSRMLLQRLVMERPTAAGIVIGTRPDTEGLAAHPARLALEPRVESIALEALSTGEIDAALSRGFFDAGQRAALVSWIQQRAAGRPGRVAPLIVQARRAGALVPRAGRFDVEPDRLPALPALDSDLAACRTLLAGLEPAARRVVEAVAILGGRGRQPAVKRVSGLDGGGGFAAAFRSCLRRGFLLSSAAGDRAEALLALASGLSAPSVVALIPRERRRERYSLAAAVIDDPVDRARCLRGAGRVAEAIELLAQQARSARAGGDVAVVAGRYRMVAELACTEPGAGDLGLREAAARVMETTGESILERRLREQLHAQLPPGEQWVRNAARLGVLLIQAGEREPAMARLEEARAAATGAAGSDRLMAHVLAEFGVVLQFASDQRAMRMYEEAMALARRAGSPDLEQVAVHRLGGLLYVNGRLLECVHFCQRAIELAERRQLIYRELRSRVTLAIARSRLGDPRGRDALKQVLKQCRRLGHLDTAAVAVHHLMIVHAKVGDWRYVRGCLDEGLALAVRRGAVHDEMFVRWLEALVERETGSLPAAARLSLAAAGIAESIGERSSRAQLLGNLARYHLEMGQDDDCRRLARRAMGLNRGETTHLAAPLAMALLLCREGRLAGARRLTRLARRRIEAREDVSVGLAETWQDIATVELAAGNLDGARSALGAMRAIAAQLDGPHARALVYLLEARIALREDGATDPVARFTPALVEFERCGLSTVRWQAEAELGCHLLDQGRERRDPNLCKQALAHLERAHEGLNITGAATGEVRACLDEARRALAAAAPRPGALARRLLAGMFGLIGSIPEGDTLPARALELIADALGAGRGAVLLKDRRSGRLEVAAARGLPRRAQRRALEMSRPILREVTHPRAPAAVDDSAGEPWRGDRRSMRLREMRGTCCVPLVATGRALGSLYLERSGRAGSWAPQTRVLLEQVAACLAAALHQAMVLDDGRRANERLRARTRSLRRAGPAGAGAAPALTLLELVGASPAMTRVRQRIERAALSSGTVIFAGGPGTGKQHAARVLHQWSERCEQPFVAIDLRRREPTAGAGRRLAALAERVAGGTLYVRGVDEAGRSFWEMILQRIDAGAPVAGEAGEEKEEERPRAERRARLVLGLDAEHGNVVGVERLPDELRLRTLQAPIELPPLAARRVDIPLLIEHRVDRFRRAHGGRASSPCAAFIDACAGHDWRRANLRELFELLERGLREARAPDDWMGLLGAHLDATGAKAAAAPPTYAERLREFERAELTQALRSVHWNQAAAARLLAIPEATLRYKVRTLHILSA